MNENVVPEWVQSLGDLAVQLRNKKGADATVATIADGATTMIPGATSAGVTIVSDGRVDVVASTADVVGELAEVQSQANEGPSLGPMSLHRRVHIADTTTETRWPKFTAAALERGVRSALLFRLFVEPRRVGVLSLYADQVGAFGADSLVIGDVFAQHAAAAIVGVTAEEQFNQALSSRDVIGQAKGIIMHQRQVTGLQAFQLLVQTSQNANIKVVELARWLVERHEAPLTVKSDKS